MRVPAIQQHDATDCGAACLASIARAHGLAIPIARIRQFADTDAHGTTALGLIRAAERLGFTAKGVRATPDAIDAIPLPAIAHVIRGALQHWVVVERLTSTHVHLMDPADGKRVRSPRPQFAREMSGVMLILTPGSLDRSGISAPSHLSRFWQLLSPHRSVLLAALIGAAVHTLLGLATMIYVQQLVDHVLVDGNRNLLALMSVVMIAILLAQSFIGVLKGLLILQTGQRIDARLILGYHTHLLNLPQRFFDTMRVGEITSRVTDAVKIRALINDVGLELVLSVLVVTLSLGLLAVYSLTLAAVVGGSIPLYILIWNLSNARHRSASRELMEKAAELQSQLVESISCIGTVKRFALQTVTARRTEAHVVRVLRAVVRSIHTSLMAGAATAFTARLSVVVLLWVGATLVIQQRLTPGQLMSCYALLGYLTAPLIALLSANRQVQDALIAADRLFEIMDLEREQPATRITLDTAHAGDVQLEDVTFRYGARAPVLRNVSLTIAAGSITAIVGESGSGKSTIASLIQRVYAPEQGRVRIGGIDIRHFSAASLSALVCSVPQRIDLFAGSVIDNLALGDPSPDLARALDATQRAGLANVIEQLPAGFETDIGENGSTLSGGERQRLAIARALYRDPRVFILDEATSSLDAQACARVRELMKDCRSRGVTIIAIAHQLDLIAGADEIIVMHEGAVVERGTHADLMVRHGHYARLWQRGAHARVA